MASIDRKIFFDSVRSKPFGGKLDQSQVDGMEAILTAWEADYSVWDLRWLAYCLATTFHETAQEMLPVEEYGKGQGMSYGKADPTTKQTYYGRGYVQLTWADNYKRADSELELKDDSSCYWHAANALNPIIAAQVMFIGMSEGWFRSNNAGERETLQKYFNDTRDDPFGAREIINGDKTKVPSWSNGVNIGNLIKSYHNSFLAALLAAYIEEPYPPELEAEEETTIIFRVVITGRGPFTATIEEVEDDPSV
jgi:putative chitinase